jgi:GntR family transcriptional regulator/MocR family aminotransferase
LKSQITDGVYGPGERLPSTRALAIELGVSRTTVTAAYEQLLSEGFLESRQGARTQVARTLRQDSRFAAELPVLQPPERLSDYAERLRRLASAASPTTDCRIADFRYGDLASGDFPTLMWKRALSTAVQRRPQRLAYADPCGSRELRTALQAYLWRARSLRCDLDQIIVVNGSQQGLDLCARLLIDAGDRIIIEDPCYAMARRLFMAAGAVPLPIEVDQDGLRTDQFPPQDDVRLVYVTPSHQFPLGSVMSAGRRQDLLVWSQRTNAYVIEDDYDSEYRYDIRPIPPLQVLGNAGKVIYIGTVSKTLSPTLRLGYLVVPKALQEVFAAAKQLADRHAPLLEQEALADLIASGAYERHVRKARRSNAGRRATLLAALQAHLGERVTVAGADAGLHVVLWFNEFSRKHEAKLVSNAQLAGIGIYPISPLYADADADVSYRPDRAGIVMGYASLAASAIERGVVCLRGVLDVLCGITRKSSKKADNRSRRDLQ